MKYLVILGTLILVTVCASVGLNLYLKLTINETFKAAGLLIAIISLLANTYLSFSNQESNIKMEEEQKNFSKEMLELQGQQAKQMEHIKNQFTVIKEARETFIKGRSFLIKNLTFDFKTDSISILEYPIHTHQDLKEKIDKLNKLALDFNNIQTSFHTCEAFYDQQARLKSKNSIDIAYSSLGPILRNTTLLSKENLITPNEEILTEFDKTCNLLRDTIKSLTDTFDQQESIYYRDVADFHRTILSDNSSHNYTSVNDKSA